MFKYLRDNSGVALLSVMAVAAVLLITSTVMLKMASTEARMVIRHGDNTRAFYLAEAGADLAVKEWYDYINNLSVGEKVSLSDYRNSLNKNIDDLEIKFSNRYNREENLSISYEFDLEKGELQEEDILTVISKGTYRNGYYGYTVNLSYKSGVEDMAPPLELDKDEWEFNNPGQGKWKFPNDNTIIYNPAAPHINYAIYKENEYNNFVYTAGVSTKRKNQGGNHEPEGSAGLMFFYDESYNNGINKIGYIFGIDYVDNEFVLGELEGDFKNGKLHKINYIKTNSKDAGIDFEKDKEYLLRVESSSNMVKMSYKDECLFEKDISSSGKVGVFANDAGGKFDTHFDFSQNFGYIPVSGKGEKSAN